MLTAVVMTETQYAVFVTTGLAASTAPRLAANVNTQPARQWNEQRYIHQHFAIAVQGFN